MINKIKSKKIQLKKNDKFNPLFMALFAGVFVVAGFVIILSKAAPPPPTIYMTPASQTYGPNSTVTLQIRENSGTSTTNAVQANFSYPTSQLTFVSIDTTGSAFTTAAEASCSAGQCKIARGIIGTLTNDQLIATVTFTTTSTSGTANLAFTTGTALVSSTTNQNLLSSLAATAGAALVVDATGPATSITAPANNASLSFGNNTTVTATATDSASSVTKVEIYIDGSLKTTLTTNPYNYTWSGATLGAHSISAKGYDTYNNVTTSSTINVTVADQTGPTVSITAPTANAVVNGAATTVTASSSDNVGVVGVQFKLDGANLGTEDTTSPYSISWDTTSTTSGTHSITAVSRDASGNSTTSSSVSVNVDNTAPTVSITAPTAGSNVSGTTTVSATAADNTGGSGLSKVEFYVDGTLKATDTTSPYSFSWDTSAYSIAAHSLTAKAYDNASTANSTTSSAVSVNVVDSTAPSAPTSLVKTSSNLNSIGFSWGASTDNIGVTGYVIKRDGATITTTTSLSYTDIGLSPGTSYTYTVSARDAAGNTSTAATLTASTTALKPGDLNQDGSVDLFDLSILLSNWSSTSTPQYDLNSNGVVDIFDLSVLLTNYGT